MKVKGKKTNAHFLYLAYHNFTTDEYPELFDGLCMAIRIDLHHDNLDQPKVCHPHMVFA